ncbi:MAG: hypothetical protein ABIO92_04500 [Chloroflexia bacterium]
MSNQNSEGIPASPEGQSEYVREELDQDQVTHRGDKREAPDKQPPQKEDTGQSKHMGAVDDEVVPVVPPMSGPADIVGEKDQNAQGNDNGNSEDEDLFDPYDHITPG